jgi:hypothetical protein
VRRESDRDHVAQPGDMPGKWATIGSVEGKCLVTDLPIGDERGRLLASLAATLARLDGDLPLPKRLCHAVARLTGADGVALTLEYVSDSRTTLCATDDVAESLENLQELLGQGPGFHATHTRDIAVANLDNQSHPSWPMLEQAVHERYGVLNLYAIPILTNSELAGVMTLYTWPRTQLRASLRQAQFLVNAVGAAVLEDFQQSGADGDGLDGAWNSRAIVHQATGMVMAQLGCSPQDAMALLRGHAYAHETDVYDIATRVVDNQIDFSHFHVEGD